MHVKVISYDRSGHVSTKCKDFRNEKNRKKKKKITRPRNEVRSHGMSVAYIIHDTTFHVLDSFFMGGRGGPVVNETRIHVAKFFVLVAFPAFFFHAFQ